MTNMKQMGCGNCGGNEFAVYAPSDERRHLLLVVECLACKSTSHIEPSKPSLVIEWGENGGGILSVSPE